MTTGRSISAEAGDPALLYLDKGNPPVLAIGDRVVGPSPGIVVDIDEDVVVVARRNAQGRCMELVFVGDAVKTLRTA